MASAGAISGTDVPALGKTKRVLGPVIDTPISIGVAGSIKSPGMMPLKPTPVARAVPSILVAPLSN